MIEVHLAKYTDDGNQTSWEELDHFIDNRQGKQDALCKAFTALVSTLFKYDVLSEGELISILDGFLDKDVTITSIEKQPYE